MAVGESAIGEEALFKVGKFKMTVFKDAIIKVALRNIRGIEGKLIKYNVFIGTCLYF
jgi:hypothetical protein